MSNSGYKQTAENVFLRNYFKYDVMSNYIGSIIASEQSKELASGKTIDVFINMNSMCKCFYTSVDYVQDYIIGAAGMINLCAHVRNFFYSRFNLMTRIYIVYGNTQPDSATRFTTEYDYKFALQRSVKTQSQCLINQTCEVLSILVPYIPDVFFINDQRTEPGVLIRSLIKIASENNGPSYRFVLTKDMYDYQLVATAPNCHIIRPKKALSMDTSYTISYGDFWDRFNDHELAKQINKIGLDPIVSPELYSLYIAIAGCRSRNLNSICSFVKTDSIIKSCITHGILSNGYNSSLGLYQETIASFPGIPQNRIDEIYNRFLALDLLYQQNIYINTTGYSVLEKSLINLYDPEAVRAINNKYFTTLPLNLDAF